MNDSRHSMRFLVYIIIALLLLIVIINILSGLLRLISFLASTVLTIAFALLVGYVIYRFIRSILRER